MRIGAIGQPPTSRVAVGVAAVFAVAGLAGCGSDEQPPATAAAKAPASASPDETTSSTKAAGTWVDYMVIREGRTCQLRAEGNGISTRGSISTVDVARTGDQTRFTQVTSVRVVGSAAEPTVTEVPYSLLPDGSLRAGTSFPTGAGMKATIDGEMKIPSVAELRAGKSRKTTYTVSIAGESAASQEQLESQLEPGAKKITIKNTVEIGPAPKKTSIKTATGVYRDLVGYTTDFTDVEIENVGSGALRRQMEQLKAALEGGETTLYFAKDVGPIQTISMGVPVTTGACTG